MSIRQRLRVAFNTKAPHRVCWRCALTSSRQSSSLSKYEASPGEEEILRLEPSTLPKSVEYKEDASRQALRPSLEPLDVGESNENAPTQSIGQLRRSFRKMTPSPSSEIRPHVRNIRPSLKSLAVGESDENSPTQSFRGLRRSFRKIELSSLPEERERPYFRSIKPIFRKISLPTNKIMVRKHSVELPDDQLPRVHRTTAMLTPRKTSSDVPAKKLIRMCRSNRNRPPFRISFYRAKREGSLKTFNPLGWKKPLKQPSLALNKLSFSFGRKVSKPKVAMNRMRRVSKRTGVQISETLCNPVERQDLEDDAKFDLALKKVLENLSSDDLITEENTKPVIAPELRPVQTSNSVTRQKTPLSGPLWSTNRSYHTSANMRSQVDLSTQGLVDKQLISSAEDMPILEHLRIWQKQQIIKNRSSQQPTNAFFNLGASHNPISQGPQDDVPRSIAQNDDCLEDTAEDFDRTEEDSADIPTRGFFFTRGDMVQFRASREPIIAVFVQILGTESLFYSMQGKWESRKISHIDFIIPRMFSRSDVDPIIPYVPTEQASWSNLRDLPQENNVPRGIGGKIIEKMLHFNEETNDLMRTHADRLDNIHEMIAHPTNLKTVSIHDIGLRVFQKTRPSDLTMTMLYAIHRATSDYEYFLHRYLIDRQSSDLYVISKQDTEDHKKVREWMREYQEDIVKNVTGTLEKEASATDGVGNSNPLSSFIVKARDLIHESRETRDVTRSGIGPSSADPEVEAEVEMEADKVKADKIEVQRVRFNFQEQKILRLLFNWSITLLIDSRSSLSAIGPMILRAIGMYDHVDADKDIGYVLLQELGCFSPWANRVLCDPRFPLPGHGFHRRLDSLQTRADRSSATLAGMKDGMESFRKDWKDLPVYCIDSANTVVFDDGLSLEEIDGDPSAFWVHIHIANPSAFLSPDSQIASFAKEMTSSVYLPEGVYRMLPPATQADFSLKPDRPCITFSAKLTAEGRILQSEITHGVIRNIKHVTPEMVDRKLAPNGGNVLKTTTLTVGGDAFSETPLRSPAQILDPSDAVRLRKLYELSTARRIERERKGALERVMEIQEGGTNVHFPPNVQDKVAFYMRNPRLFAGDPVISITNTRLISDQGKSPVSIEKMVGEIMILAGEIAASWCSQRNIPTVFRGTIRNRETSTSAELFKTEFLNPAVAKFGSVTRAMIGRYGMLLGRSGASALPLEHVPMGISEYCRATSPLRRYEDLITHWQIEAAIRREAETGVSSIGNTSDKFLPFSRAKVASMIPHIHDRAKANQISSRNSRDHWRTLLMFRAFYLHEAPLPDTFEVVVYSSGGGPVHGRSPSRGYLVDLGILCSVAGNDLTAREGNIDSGDVWEARIADVNVYRREITMDPVRLIRKGDPAMSDARFSG